MHTLYLVLLAVAVATTSTMELPAAPSPFEPVPLLESVIPDGQVVISRKDKDKEQEKNKKDRSGKAFTKRQKEIVKERNAKENDGKIRCVNCKVETVPGKRHQKGVTPPSNEAHVDDEHTRSKGGAGEVETGALSKVQPREGRQPLLRRESEMSTAGSDDRVKVIFELERDEDDSPPRGLRGALGASAGQGAVPARQRSLLREGRCLRGRRVRGGSRRRAHLPGGGPALRTCHPAPHHLRRG